MFVPKLHRSLRQTFGIMALLAVNLFAAGPARVALKGGEGGRGGALLAFEVDDLDAWIERLRENGVGLDGSVKLSPEGYRRARFRDPDGHELSLFEWRSHPPEQSAATP